MTYTENGLESKPSNAYVREACSVMSQNGHVDPACFAAYACRLLPLVAGFANGALCR